MEMIFRWLHYIDTEFGQKTPVLALLVGFVCSWFLTQALKKYGPLFRQTRDPIYRLVVRVTAFLLGAFPTWLLWPQHGSVAVMMAVVVGILSPVVYTALMRAVRHFWPWLADAASGRPSGP